MNISCYNAFVDEDEALWIPSKEINGVFYKDMNGECHYLFSFEEKEGKKIEIIKTVRFQDKVFFFGRNLNKYWKYDCNNESLSEYSYGTNAGIITSAVFENGRVWLFPWDFDKPIYVIYLVDETVEMVEWNINSIDNKTSVIGNYLVGSSMIKAYYNNDKIFLANRLEDKISIIEIDCVERSIRGKRFNGIKRINALASADNKIYLLCLDDKEKTIINQVDMATWQINKSIDLSEYIVIHNQNPLEFFRLIKYDNELMIFPVKKGKVLVIKDMEDLYWLKNSNGEDSFLSCYDYQIKDEKCYLFSAEDDGISVIKRNEDGFLTAYTLIIDNSDSYYVDALKILGSKHGILKESKNLNLDTFLKSI